MAGSAFGGGLWGLIKASLQIDPRQGARKGSRQAKLTDLVAGNSASAGQARLGGDRGSATGGAGGAPNGTPGMAFFSFPTGKNGTPGIGAGGGLGPFPAPNVTIANTKITGNHASTFNNDVDGDE
jgi:hypothetical protein